MFRLLIIPSLLVFLVGCTATISPTVTRFSQPSFHPHGQTFTILPYEHQKGSLEYETYARMAQVELERLGLRPRASKGDLVLMLTYETSFPRQQIITWGYPHYGYGYGVRGCYPYRRWGGWCHFYDYRDPPRVSTITVWTKQIQAVLYDGTEFRKGQRTPLWEGKSSIDSRSPDFSASTARPLIQALFANFPGPSGVTERYQIPVE